MIERIGPALFGEHWKPQLARALGVSVRTVRRWANNGEPVPLDKLEAMLDLLFAGEREIARLQGELGAVITSSRYPRIMKRLAE